MARGASSLTRSQAAAARQSITNVIEQLQKLAVALDPVREPFSVFDASNPQTIGKFAGIALTAQARNPLADVDRFYGSGVYAIYYSGPFRPYAPLVRTENPIYVGKSDPTIPGAKTPRDQGQTLYSRLRDHARSIGKAETTLNLTDFTCRVLVVQSGAQLAAEKYLIDVFKPVWNDQTRICYGIGKHGDDPGTRANLRSPWDTLHPGRDWAHRDRTMRDAKPKQQIEAELKAHFAVHHPYRTTAEVLRQFYEDLKQR